MTKQSVLGLSFSDKSVHAVEIEQDGNLNTLMAVAELENTLPLNAEPDDIGRFV